MKKAVSIALMFVFVMFSLALPANVLAVPLSNDINKSQLGTTNTYYEYDYQSRTLTISGVGDTPNFQTNASDAPWYEWRDSSVSRVVIEEGVTSIGNYFLYEVAADEIELPNSLIKIGNYAFSYMLNITQWELPFGVKTIGSYAFANDKYATEIKIPDSVTAINSRAFQNCKSLTEFVIPYSVSTIGTYAFYQCIALEKLEFQSLSSSVVIGNYCFLGCTLLNDVAFPLNAEINQNSYGYESRTSKYSNIVMTVYKDSSAYNYALSNDFGYTLVDNIPMECGVWYENSYTEDNIENEFCYELSAGSCETYNIYSVGNCDVSAVLKDSNGNTIASSDDISNQDRNFLITEELNDSETYYLYVTSVMSTGDCRIVAYPDFIQSLDIIGRLSFDASQGDYSDDNVLFDITDEMLENHKIKVNFNNGFSDYIFYYNGIFDNKDMYYDNQQDITPFSCGVNFAQLKIGNATGDFPVVINHSYIQTVVDYTADDDGYTRYTCMLCGESYNDDFIPTPAITISGNAYIKESRNGAFSHFTPYTHFIVRVEGREYPVNSDGSWSFNTLNSCTATLANEYGDDVEISVNFEDGSYNYGNIAMQGYDFNGDGYVNGKDYALYVKIWKCPYGMNYIQYFAGNFA